MGHIKRKFRNSRNDFRNWDVGYPESLEKLPDGRVLTVYYGNLFGKYFLGWNVLEAVSRSKANSRRLRLTR